MTVETAAAAELATEAELLAAESGYPPFSGEQFEDEANQRATGALLAALQLNHRPEEVLSYVFGH
jgi:hypothetical protein